MNVANIEQAHKRMVLQLQKPGSEILAELTGTEGQIIHMFMGIVGEVGEFFELVDTTPVGTAIESKQLVEEMGDYIFFLRALYILNDIAEPSIGDLDIQFYRSKEDTLIKFIRTMGDLADTLKRPIIYRKEAKKALLPILNQLYCFYYELLSRFNLDHGEVMQGNLDKLLTGKNARYAEGVYSNEQANTRADKKGEVDEQL